MFKVGGAVFAPPPPGDRLNTCFFAPLPLVGLSVSLNRACQRSATPCHPARNGHMRSSTTGIGSSAGVTEIGCACSAESYRPAVTCRSRIRQSILDGHGPNRGARHGTSRAGRARTHVGTRSRRRCLWIWSDLALRSSPHNAPFVLTNRCKKAPLQPQQ
jgi:hypothetical protein